MAQLNSLVEVAMLTLLTLFDESPVMLLAPLVLLVVSHTLHVNVTGLHSNRGQVRVAVFSTAHGWPLDDRQALARAVLPIADLSATAHFEVPTGTYAVVAFHDEDGDGVLEKNFVGAPIEGWGASNGASGLLGPAFTDARFSLTTDFRCALLIRY